MGSDFRALLNSRYDRLTKLPVAAKMLFQMLVFANWSDFTPPAGRLDIF